VGRRLSVAGRTRQATFGGVYSANACIPPRTGYLSLTMFRLWFRVRSCSSRQRHGRLLYGQRCRLLVAAFFSTFRAAALNAGGERGASPPFPGFSAACALWNFSKTPQQILPLNITKQGRRHTLRGARRRGSSPLYRPYCAWQPRHGGTPGGNSRAFLAQLPHHSYARRGAWRTGG